MNKIYDVLAEVRNTAGKNDKIEILSKNKDVPFLREYLSLVYDPSKNYYIKKWPASAVDQLSEYTDEQFAVELTKFCADTNNRTLSGHATLTALKDMLRWCNLEQRELFRYLIARDVEAGFNISTINKVWKDLIFVPNYQRCETEDNARFDKWDWSKRHYVQLKADGMFVNVIKTNDAVDFMTRSGNVFPRGSLSNLAWLVHEYIPVDNVVHGELLVLERGEVLPRTTGNGILNSVLQGEALPEQYTIRLLAWDILGHDEWKQGLSTETYSKRAGKLFGLLTDAPSSLSVITTHMIDSVESAKQIALDWMKQGYEGAIVKNSDGIWKDHTSPNQIKIKADLDLELRVVGMVDGKGKNKDTFGSLACVSEDEKLRVDVSGFTDEMRQYIFDHWHEEFYGQVITVKANQLLKPGKNNTNYSLFLPRFVEVRHDRQEADDIERIISIFKPYQPDL